jgi:hypothetical protein
LFTQSRAANHSCLRRGHNEGGGARYLFYASIVHGKLFCFRSVFKRLWPERIRGLKTFRPPHGERFSTTHHGRFFKKFRAVDCSRLRRCDGEGCRAKKLIYIRIVHGKLFFSWFRNTLGTMRSEKIGGLSASRPPLGSQSHTGRDETS